MFLTKKRFVYLLMAVLMVFSLAACGGGDNGGADADSDTEDTVLVALTQSAYPPFAYMDENGEFQGFDVEVLREVDRRLDGYTIDIQTLPWDSQFLAIESNKADIICNQVADTPEREEKYALSDPYFLAAPSIIVKKGRTDINSIDDLAGKSVWAQVGDSYTTVLEKYNEEHENKINLHYVENQMLADAFYDLQIGKFDAVTNDPVMANAVIKEKGLEVEVVGEPLYTEDICMVFNKDKGAELRDKVNEIIKEMKEDGTLSKLSVELTGADYIPE